MKDAGKWVPGPHLILPTLWDPSYSPPLPHLCSWTCLSLFSIVVLVSCQNTSPNTADKSNHVKQLHKGFSICLKLCCVCVWGGGCSLASYFYIVQKKGWVLSYLGNGETEHVSTRGRILQHLLPAAILALKVPQSVSQVSSRVGVLDWLEFLSRAGTRDRLVTKWHFLQGEIVANCKVEKEMEGAGWLKNNLQLLSSSPQG